MTSDRRWLALGAVFFLGCVTHEEGTWVAVNVAGESASPSAFVHRRAALGVVTVELVPCESGLSALLDLLSPIGTAYAHERDPSPLVSARTESMEAGEPARTLEVLSPAAGRYCSVRIALGAGRDVPAALAVEGRLDGADVALSTSYHLDLDTALEPELVLDEDHRMVAITFVVAPDRWLDGLTPEVIAAGGIEVEQALADNVRRTTRVVVER